MDGEDLTFFGLISFMILAYLAFWGFICFLFFKLVMWIISK